MDIVELMRDSASKGHGRTLTETQLKYLLAVMGRMAYDRQQALHAMDGAAMMVEAYINEYGDELFKALTEEEVVDGEVETSRFYNEDARVFPSLEEEE